LTTDSSGFDFALSFLEVLMQKILYTSILLGLLILTGCSQNCDKEMKKIKDKYGEAEEITTYDSGDYHSVSWWYWSLGIEYTFVWGKNVDGCEKSKYTFDPISYESKIKKTDKDKVQRLKILESKQNTKDCIICPE
jgi:hypothetical protein